MSCGTLQRTCLVALLAWISSAPNGTSQCADWAKDFGLGGQPLNHWSTLAYDRTGVLGPPAVYAGLLVDQEATARPCASINTVVIRGPKGTSRLLVNFVSRTISSRRVRSTSATRK